MDDLLKEICIEIFKQFVKRNTKKENENLKKLFTPKLKSMLEQKIQSEIEDEDEISRNR